MDSFAGKLAKIDLSRHSRIEESFLNYGTAGFRTKAEKLDHVLYRMGMLAALRSQAKNGATIGVMITASHNPEEDNGVKLVDPQGEMLEAAWEKHAAHLANVIDGEIASCLQSLVATCEIDTNLVANVVYARDTRPSSAQLAQALQDGLVALGANYTDYGLLTTPQLHYMVRCLNTSNKYGEPTEVGYYHKLGSAFCSLQETASKRTIKSYYIDGANGIGAPKMSLMIPHLEDRLTFTIYNDGNTGKLNYQCGADYVKMYQTCPQGITLNPGMECASFDGDADRIVFYYMDSENTFHLLDGDKIATLLAGYLKELLTQCGMSLNLGLVQTAYANGSSTRYISQQLCVPVACVPTGVKYLHHKALEFDIGVYFEANGHGTVLFSEQAEQQIRHLANESSSKNADSPIRRLCAVIDLINQTVGDAISDLLLVITVLQEKGWSFMDWDKAYTDLPNRQLKVTVLDRTVIQTTDAERKVTAPDGLQEAIDSIVAGYKDGRSFVRPSGTEDIVRIYAEADIRANADLLAFEVGVKVYELAGGIGEKPSKPVS